MSTNKAYFSPGDDCLNHILELIDGCENSLDICVFTISDDRIKNALLNAHVENVAIRVISDNDKLKDEGSDIKELSQRGIAVKIDTTPYHMHHKFMIVDGKTLLTGSYNWTRSAARFNQENVLSMQDANVISSFQEHFDELWEKCVSLDEAI
jgi:mitochondrial cardiolipin hydrolase